VALTPQQVADRLNFAGLDTEAKFDTFIATAGALVKRNELSASIEKARADQAAANQQSEAAVQDLEAQIRAIDDRLRGA
jgi:hypothetical protein